LSPPLVPKIRPLYDLRKRVLRYFSRITEGEVVDPVTIALSLLMKNPNVAHSAVQMAERATAPGIVDVAKMQTSIADLARGVITCYHKTAHFRAVDVAPGPWNRQSQYGAENSAVMRIRYAGVTETPHQMIVAVMAKENQVRTAVLSDSNPIPFSKRCQLEDWTAS
jgi:hypothetical protein